MACSHLASASLTPPGPTASVYREDCTQCFDSIDDPDGLDVCLHCFNGGCVGHRAHATLHAVQHAHPIVLNVRRTPKVIERDEPPAKMSKLAIVAESEEDRYDTATKARCLECATELDPADPLLAPTVRAVMAANTFARKEEVKAWELELTSCEHILTLQQAEPGRAIRSGQLAHCSGCDLGENLWLCLECGNLGCGRRQMGGVEGNSHGLAHANESGHGVAVKLGSITPEGTADVYCYRCDEERVDADLAVHLAHWGIILAERQKTEKSLTEMQIEQNLKWDFSMTTEDGKTLVPVFGPGLTGLRNLGNSCYMASVVQCLLDLPAFRDRYYRPDDGPASTTQDPAADLETQLRKMADGLYSGRYSKPYSRSADTDSAADPDVLLEHQRGLAPAMLKHLIGRGHAEFSTMRQQDAFEFLQHMVKMITRSRHTAEHPDPTRVFRFVTEQRLQCMGCSRVRYSTTEQDNISVDVPLEKAPPAERGEAAESPADTYRVVSLKECLDNFTGMERVELTCASCKSRAGFMKRILFKTFPDVLAVNARKMTMINWVPIKVDVPLLVPDGPFSLDQYLSPGRRPSEEELPDNELVAASAAPADQIAFVPHEGALAQLEAMGFPRNRCEKALHATGNCADAEVAMEWLFSHLEDPDIDAPLLLPAAGAGAGAGAAVGDDPEKIEILCSMGFSAPQARKALRETNAHVERAVEWLFSHPDDQGVIDEAASEPQAGAAKTEPNSEELAGSARLPAMFQLQSIACHKGTSIHAGHYVAFIRKNLPKEESSGQTREAWVLFNDEKVVEAVDFEEMRKFAYLYFFKRVEGAS